jgi:hypothetical protein
LQIRQSKSFTISGIKGCGGAYEHEMNHSFVSITTDLTIVMMDTTRLIHHYQTKLLKAKQIGYGYCQQAVTPTLNNCH